MHACPIGRRRLLQATLSFFDSGTPIMISTPSLYRACSLKLADCNTRRQFAFSRNRIGFVIVDTRLPRIERRHAKIFSHTCTCPQGVETPRSSHFPHGSKPIQKSFLFFRWISQSTGIPFPRIVLPDSAILRRDDFQWRS